MKKLFMLLAALIRIALGVAAIAAIYNVIRSRKGRHGDGPHGRHQA
jgi:hypothetical protein